MSSGRPAKITHCSNCRHFGKTRKTKGIAGEYLCLFKCAGAHRRARETHEPIQDPKRARALYQASRVDSRTSIILPSYRAMRKRFKSGKASFRELGAFYQRSGMRMHQIYREFFSVEIPGRLSDREQREELAQENRRIERIVRAEQLFFKNPAIASLRSVTEHLGLEIRVISLGGIGGRILSIGGKKCVIYVCMKTCTFNPKSRKHYWEYIVSTSALKIADLVIFAGLDVKGFQFFIVPRDTFSPGYFQVRQFKNYIPQEGPSPKKGRKPKIDMARFKNAWHLLKSSANEKTATAVESSSVPSSPAY